MKVVSTRADLRAGRAKLETPLGLVPTMGALHDGHISLARAARAENRSVIATIFVNPAQFGPNEDFSKYPRTLNADLERLEAEGVDLVFAPGPDEMYLPGFQTTVEVAHVSQGLEGERRPGHFRGVATVVTKLFNLTQPTIAYFGQKDAQQVVVIRRMVADLDMPVGVAIIPTFREVDGLAMSSRNRYLSAEQRAAAPVIYRGLCAAAERYASGERRPDSLRAAIRDVITSEAAAEIDYISIADPCSLQEVTEPQDAPLLASLTVRFGQVRLLDNLLLPGSLNDRAGLTATLGAI